MLRNLIIRDMESEDLHPVFSLGQKIFHDRIDNRGLPGWSPENIAETVSRDNVSLVAVQRKKILGFLISSLYQTEKVKKIHIAWITADLIKYEQQILNQLFKGLLIRIKDQKITVITANVDYSHEVINTFFKEKGFTEKSKYAVIEHFLEQKDDYS